MGTGVSPSHSIVTQIAAAEGIAPTDLEPPLHDVIDPDALDQLVDSSGYRSNGPTMVIEFAYQGRTVRVDGTGAVEVTAANQLTETDSNTDSTEESHGD
ncbi:hypothetical protein GS429_15045 [Natronorubrum sp. JWXQ-INN-674]|uniref:Halobacterial output domain-containing protein n=1 Tax=Natronorubrum halalkaliphilum TaxID=2691917 RepID=A0A6B0VQS4_9EURY|nr:HalOD1 output domain-containing protein [Natronorubrum halalkaliphilum]MXV63356.1 hypothetical protein [Natronorubrum halalkaliphilum]